MKIFLKVIKKTFVPFAVLVFAFSFSNAQWVNIPDANFRTWLSANGYASCMSGTMMDTTCSAVVNATSVDCNTLSIYDLTGIQYFDNLQFLNCKGINFRVCLLFLQRCKNCIATIICLRVCHCCLAHFITYGATIIRLHHYPLCQLS